MFGYKPALLPVISGPNPNMVVVGDYFSQRQLLISILRRELAIAQNCMKQVADKRTE